uniref:Protein CNPPD1 n=1 Tax=Ciona savignyi TaxID=51511 RepID=H2YAM4_CIOSA
MDWSNEMEEFLSKSEFIEDNELETNIFQHYGLSERLRKTFYYSPQKNPAKDTLSFSITKETVESFRKAAPTSFGKLGHRYAARVARDACVSPCSMLLAMIYIERLAHRDPEYLQNISSSDLFLVSMMVASKYMYDEGIEDEVFNDEWAASGLADTDHVNELEVDFLRAIDWRVMVRKPEFQATVKMIEARVALEHGLGRGWFSYTDSTCLLKSKKIIDNIKRTIELFSQAMCLCVVLYGSFVMLTITSVAMLKAKPSKTVANVPVFPDQTVSLGFVQESNVSSTDPEIEDATIEEITIALQEPQIEITSQKLTQPTQAAQTFPSDPQLTPVKGGGMAQVLTLVETMFFLSVPSCLTNETDEYEPYICPRCQQDQAANQLNQKNCFFFKHHEKVPKNLPENPKLYLTSDSLLKHSFNHKHIPPSVFAQEKSLYSPNFFHRPVNDASHYHCTHSLPGVFVIT